MTQDLYEDGWDAGYSTGHTDGHDLGYDVGYHNGYCDAQRQIEADRRRVIRWIVAPASMLAVILLLFVAFG